MRQVGMWAALLLLAGVARADLEPCVPNATNVTKPDPKVYPANWGAAYHSFNYGTSPNDVEVRLRADATHVYVSLAYSVSVPSANITDATTLWFGIGDSATQGTLIKLSLPTVTPTVANTDANSFADATVYPVTGVTAGAGINPAWLLNNTWLDIVFTGATATFQVQMALPINANINSGVPLTNAAKFTFYAQAELPTALALVGPRIGTPMSVVPGDPDAVYDGGNALAVAKWTPVAVAATLPAVSECQVTGGVVVPYDLVGRVDSTAPTGYDNTFLLFGPTGTPVGSQTLQANQLGASIFNSTGAPIAANDLEVTYTVANWGSQALPQNWVPLNDKGNKIILSGGNKIFDPTGVPLKFKNTAPLPQANQIDAKITWTADITYACQFNDVNGLHIKDLYPTQCAAASTVLPSAPGDFLSAHQCMQITAHSAGGHFTDVVRWRNMDFVHASSFNREAVIDAGPMRGTTGDIYIYVETRNLPVVYADPNGKKVEFKKTDARGEGTRFADAPTYIVHVYRDTGKVYKLNKKGHPTGKHRKILIPQNSFGYYVDHQGGPVFGWDHAFGSQMPMLQLAPNLYLIRNAKGKVTVRNQLKSFDRPLCKGHGCQKIKLHRLDYPGAPPGLTREHHVKPMKDIKDRKEELPDFDVDPDSLGARK